MTTRQRILKLVYPLIKRFARMSAGNKTILENKEAVKPMRPFYELAAETNGGSVDFKSLQGRKVLLVNVASGCGYTSQYDELRVLQEEYKDRLSIIGFPSNDFKGQEPGSDKEIEQFCRINYQIDFPLALKAPVTGPDQQPVYQWLSQKNHNGWNDQPPSWNFCKYLVDEQGVLLEFYPPFVSPLDPVITGKL